MRALIGGDADIATTEAARQGARRRPSVRPLGMDGHRNRALECRTAFWSWLANAQCPLGTNAAAKHRAISARKGNIIETIGQGLLGSSAPQQRSPPTLDWGCVVSSSKSLSKSGSKSKSKSGSNLDPRSNFDPDNEVDVAQLAGPSESMRSWAPSSAMGKRKTTRPGSSVSVPS